MTIKRVINLYKMDFVVLCSFSVVFIDAAFFLYIHIQNSYKPSPFE